jgi:hypothetical protein
MDGSNSNTLNITDTMKHKYPYHQLLIMDSLPHDKGNSSSRPIFRVGRPDFFLLIPNFSHVALHLQWTFDRKVSRSIIICDTMASESVQSQLYHLSTLTVTAIPVPRKSLFQHPLLWKRVTLVRSGFFQTEDSNFCRLGR